ncbi:MAG: DUF1559 domain-containing protein [Planctomycetota bacterium]
MKRNQPTSSRNGFTIVELIVVIGVILILIGMLLPTMRTVRGPARRTACMNNMRQLGIACMNYYSAHEKLPMAMGQFADWREQGECQRLSGWVAILPEIEQQTIYNEVFDGCEYAGRTYQPAPGPWSGYPGYQTKIETFRCPSSTDGPSDYGQTNYAFCIGDIAREIHQPKKLRGVFGVGIECRLDDILDGCSNTIAIAEMGTGGTRDSRSHFAINQPTSLLQKPSKTLDLVSGIYPGTFDEKHKLNALGRGANWADGTSGYAMVNTILPPNSPSAAIKGDVGMDGFYSAGSFHQGGCIVTFADGSSRFISEDIDTGDLDHASLSTDQYSDLTMASPYGVWGALGSIEGDEDIHEMSW